MSYLPSTLFKLVSEGGTLLTSANTDGRKPVPGLMQDRIGKLFSGGFASFGRGYVSQALFEQLYDRDLQLITKSKRNMKNRLMTRMDKILLCKRALLESVNDHLKNIC